MRICSDRSFRRVSNAQPVGAAIGRRLVRSGIFATLCVLIYGGCGKSGVEGELLRFRDAGHTVSAFADSNPATFHAKKCQNGTIDELPVLICEFGNSEGAAAAQPAAESWGGDVGTVVVLRRGPICFAIADRKHADPNGKTISALAKVFRRANGR